MEQEEQTENTARYLSLIRGRTQAMKDLTEELIPLLADRCRDETLQPETVDLGAAVEESMASFYEAFTGRGICPQVVFPEGKVLRRLDAAALSRLLGNILNNALKYSDGDLAVQLTSGGTLTVSNRASALSEVAVGRLFDRFFTVEAARNSTGLGLSIAKLLTERMGGTITAQYEAERLSILLEFPMDAEA